LGKTRRGLVYYPNRGNHTSGGAYLPAGSANLWSVLHVFIRYTPFLGPSCAPIRHLFRAIRHLFGVIRHLFRLIRRPLAAFRAGSEGCMSRLGTSPACLSGLDMVLIPERSLATCPCPECASLSINRADAGISVGSRGISVGSREDGVGARSPRSRYEPPAFPLRAPPIKTGGYLA
jgi:hypothetical protein